MLVAQPLLDASSFEQSSLAPEPNSLAILRPIAIGVAYPGVACLASVLLSRVGITMHNKSSFSI